MKIVQFLQSLFAEERFVCITPENGYKAGSHRRLFGSLTCWIHRGEYVYLPTLWKAHREVSRLIEDISKNSTRSIQKLISFQKALQSFSCERNKEFNDLILRIQKVVSSQEAKPHSLEPEQLAEKCIMAFMQPESPSSLDCFYEMNSWCEARRKNVLPLILEYFFDPIVMEACQLFSQEKSSVFSYHEMLCKVKISYQRITAYFGREEVTKCIEQREFFKLAVENFLIPFYRKNIFNKKNEECMNALHKLRGYVDDFQCILEGSIVENALWKDVSCDLAQRFELCISQPQLFQVQQPLLSEKSVIQLGSYYKETNKEAVTMWLTSLPRAQELVECASRHISRGVYIGKRRFTDFSFEIPYELSAKDREIIICWEFYQELVAYCKKNNVKDPEEEASLLFVHVFLNTPVLSFFQNLGALSGKNISSMPVGIHGDDKGAKVFFSCKANVLYARWKQEFRFSDNYSGFYVSGSLRCDKEKTLTRIKTNPSLGTERGYCIEGTQGSYTLRRCSSWSKLQAFFCHRESFSVSQEGMKALFQRIPKISETTFLSLCSLRRNLKKISPQGKASPSLQGTISILEMHIAKARMENGVVNDKALGKFLADQLIKKCSGKEILLSDFLIMLESKVLDVLQEYEHPEGILEALLIELKGEYPVHTELFEEKRVSFSSLGKRYFNLDREPSEETSEKIFVLFKDAITTFSFHMRDRVENFFIEKGLPMCTSLMGKYVLHASPQEDPLKYVVKDFTRMQELFPNPRVPFLGSIVEELLKIAKTSDSAEDFLARIGEQIGFEIAEEAPELYESERFLEIFHEKVRWISKAFPFEQVRILYDWMLRTCGLQYGQALAEQCERIDIKKYLIIQERERLFAPKMFSQVLRGFLCGIDKIHSSEEDRESFCTAISHSLLESSTRESGESWFKNEFRTYLSIPLSSSLKKIFHDVVMAILQKYPQEQEVFLSRLACSLLKEIHLLAARNAEEAWMHSYLDFIESQGFPEFVMKKVQDALEGGMRPISTI